MPCVDVVGGVADLDSVPLLNASEEAEDAAPVVPASFESDDSDAEPGHEASEASDASAEARERQKPDEEGRYFDDPLWYGKTLTEIKNGTEHSKSAGNDASKGGDWKVANRCWKDAFKGAEKLKDTDLQIKLRLNLALGYVKCEKPAKALEQCAAIFAVDLAAKASLEQRAKARYREADAHALAGDDTKAMASLRICLELQPGNAEAKRRLVELRRSQEERRQRESAFFKAGLAKAAEADRQREQAAELSLEGLPRAAAPQPSDLTDRRRANLVARAHGGSGGGAADVNVQCGAPMTVMGPLRPSPRAAASAAGVSNPQDQGEASNEDRD